MALLLDQPVDPAPEEPLQRSEDEARANRIAQAAATAAEEAHNTADEIDDPGGSPPAGPVGDFGGIFHAVEPTHGEA